MIHRQKILVTGGNGQLGNEFKVLADAFPQYEFLFPSGGSLRIDDPEGVRDFFQSESPSFCINCAAYTAVDKAETDAEEALLVNGESVGQLAALCKEFKTGFIHISTDYVFDGTASVPYTEKDVPNPVNVYGASKLDGEKKAMRNNGDSVIIRTSWLYSSFGKNFVKTMLRLMDEKEELRVVNDQHGSPTYAADLAAAVMTIIASAQWHAGIFHFSNSGQISWFDFAEAIKRYSKKDCALYPVPASQYPTAARRPGYSVLANNKISEVYGIASMPWEAAWQHAFGGLIHNRYPVVDETNKQLFCKGFSQ